MHRDLIEVGGSFEKLHILCQLATDPRMQKVWNELARCRRSGEYSKTDSRLYAADLTQPDFDELLRSFFRDIVHHRWQGIQTVPGSEIDRIKGHYLEMAAQLKADFAELGQYRIFDEPVALIHAATFYEKLAEATATARNDALVVTRQRTDPAILGYVRAVAQTTLESFNSHLYGTVATICNVAFGSDDLTGERIRELIRG